MSTQIAVRLSDESLSSLDVLVGLGVFPNRAEAVRAGVEMLVRNAERARVDAAIVAGYRRVPDDTSDAWLEAATRAMVAAEPW
jgi:Arc/MetJ-type ribon-helix-helix transcriptional regulator